MKLAVIPARGGSKRIPRKNIREFAGKPMIGYAINAALDSGVFDAVVVSTDDEEIASESRRLGAEVPFIRPAELADDHTPIVPVLQHAIRWLTAAGPPPSLVCCIQATAPLLKPDDLRRGHDAIANGDADFAIAVVRFSFPVERALRIKPDGRLSMIDEEAYATRSQDLEPAYHDAGQFYWGTTRAWLAGDNPYVGAVPIILPGWRVQDIDEQEDWDRAELLLQLLAARERNG
ncbi:pseudaminic acid cytidylyltransferase [Ramlibacter tataouinensis]|uniref:pseudaminic acid cytidylyltransferase n=1 Tax=Ramlibacter tataouinensis TaxID=94132 RepID=UPI0022F3F94B|nr:pseudaminic acid cytidylyltransferase [Ramlibacter tataouinensis]WBY00904.1 pseudaminic acid cytidylyltransferase [Ramlibacter tataouinensis]